jgi:hypothetical protein
VGEIKWGGRLNAVASVTREVVGSNAGDIGINIFSRAVIGGEFAEAASGGFGILDNRLVRSTVTVARGLLLPDKQVRCSSYCPNRRARATKRIGSPFRVMANNTKITVGWGPTLCSKRENG